MIRMHSSPSTRACWALIVCGTIFTTGLVLRLRFQEVRQSAIDLQCRGDLFGLGCALHAFADEFGCLPPPVITDSTGRPLYSWRVLLLPNYGLLEQYDAFDFTVPWNDPHNTMLCGGKQDSALTRLFACHANDRKAPYADYFYLLTAQHQWPRDFLLDPVVPSFLMLVEGHTRPVYWSEPVDMAYAAPGLAGALAKVREATPNHGRGYHCFISSGRYPVIPRLGTPDEDFRLLQTSAFAPRVVGDVDNRAECERLVTRLVAHLGRDSWLYNQHRALLLLGEMGPTARSAEALIREVIANGDAKLNAVARLALARISR